MGSKKQRSRQAKGNASSSSSDVRLASGPTGGSSTRAALTQQDCVCDACLKPYTPAANDCDSHFLRMPREIRDKIYEELLIAKMSSKTQAQYDEAQKAVARTYDQESGRQNALDMFEREIGIMPDGGNKKTLRFIVDALGLLLTNKQIHAEANKVLFSMNEFVILPEWERVHAFWRCPMSCQPITYPCLILFHNFVQIKHLSVVVQMLRQPEHGVVFKHAGIKLKTLKIRYISSFAGQLDAVRESIECPIDPDVPERPLTIKDTHGKYWHLSVDEAFAHLAEHTVLFAPFLLLNEFAEYVSVRGDLPQKCIDDLTRVLSTKEVSSVIKKKKADDKAAKQARSREPGFDTSFWKDMWDKYTAQGDQGMVDMAEQMLRTSIKSPAVMEMLFAPPTQESLDRWNAERPQRAAAAAQGGVVTEVTGGDEEVVATEGGIGMLNGKPVFGPPRPPQ
ncbi:hypothetical protein LTR27_012344 [Elasticomyces elasticus]|nr:hypothetical protein LTR27_012344 [Elasticomyces elasticus]